MKTQELLMVLSPIASMVAGYFIGEKKSKAEIRKLGAETDGLELKNLQAATKIWKDMVRDLRTEVDQLRTQVTRLSNQVFEFKVENEQFKEENELFKEENVQLKNEVADLRKLIQNGHQNN